MMQQLTPAKIPNNAKTSSADDLISQKKAMNDQYRLSGGQSPDKVKSMLEKFDLMHQRNDGDDEDYGPLFPVTGGTTTVKNNDIYNRPLSQSFEPPVTQSIAGESRISTENQQIMASRMQNQQMGFFGAQGGDGTTPLVAGPYMGAPARDGFGLMPMQPPTSAGYAGAAAYASPKIQDLELGRYGPAGVPQAHELYVKKMRQAPPVAAATMQFGGGDGDGDMLMKKLNYLIHLQEKQMDEKTGSATEDIIMYSFLGVFMIFIVDSFSRVGKYTRSA